MAVLTLEEFRAVLAEIRAEQIAARERDAECDEEA